MDDSISIFFLHFNTFILRNLKLHETIKTIFVSGSYRSDKNCNNLQELMDALRKKKLSICSQLFIPVQSKTFLRDDNKHLKHLHVLCTRKCLKLLNKIRTLISDDHNQGRPWDKAYKAKALSAKIYILVRGANYPKASL